MYVTENEIQFSDGEYKVSVDLNEGTITVYKDRHGSKYNFEELSPSFDND